MSPKHSSPSTSARLKGAPSISSLRACQPRETPLKAKVCPGYRTSCTAGGAMADLWRSRSTESTWFRLPDHPPPQAQRGATPNPNPPHYKMNFPRKNPMKMAAMTTSRDGRELEPWSLPARMAELGMALSALGALRILKPSSWGEGRRGRPINTVD